MAYLCDHHHRLLGGVWGAFIEIPEEAGFPATLGYSVWALTMIPCAIVALYIISGPTYGYLWLLLEITLFKSRKT